MSTPVTCVDARTPVGEAALRMQTERCRHLVVRDRGGAVVGMLSQADLALNQGIEPYLRLREVGAAMRDRPLLLAGDMLLAPTARLMHKHGGDAAIVRCEDGSLGIVTERDMVRFVAHHPGNTP